MDIAVDKNKLNAHQEQMKVFLQSIVLRIVLAVCDCAVVRSQDLKGGDCE